MTVPGQPETLIVLAADREIEETMKELLGRPKSLGIRQLHFKVQRYPGRDAGCRTNAADFLRSFRNRFSHALVVFDRERCGSFETRERIEQEVEADLARSGWRDHGKAVVIDPELEGWLWSDSPNVLKGLHWRGAFDELKSWLEQQEVWDHSSPKLHDPKAALRCTLRRTRRRKSARIFGEIANRASLKGCRDPAFRKLKSVLGGWFASR